MPGGGPGAKLSARPQGGEPWYPNNQAEGSVIGTLFLVSKRGAIRLAPIFQARQHTILAKKNGEVWVCAPQEARAFIHCSSKI